MKNKKVPLLQESAEAVVLSHLDSTSSRPTEPERRESEEQFRELMAHLQQVFWIKNAMDTGVLYASPAYETIWGRTRQSLYDNSHTFLDSVHPDDRERIARAMARKNETGGYDEEYRILKPDGQMRWVWVRTYPVRDAQGQIKRFAGIAEDITERKAAEKERSRLAAIIEYSDDVIVSMTVEGIIIGWNHGAERQYGYTTEEIIGRSISILFPPDQYQGYLELMKRVRHGESVPSYDTVRRQKDGTLTNVSVGIVPIEAHDGEIVGASKIGHDISKIKKLEARVIEAQKMEVVGQLAGGVAHDFNNILAVIIGYSDLIASELGPDNPLTKFTEEIRLASERAVGLTRQLLVFSRKQTVEPVVLDLNAVVQDLDKMLRRLIDENIEMTIVPGTQIGRIKADSGYIGQVLMNLVINARDAMPHGGRLTIETGNATLDENHARTHSGVNPGKYVMFDVSDTGTGMTNEVKAHLFEAFFTTKPKGKGTGLGLATCLTIVQQSGGHIVVNSELGKGTTFKVYLPRVDLPLDSDTKFFKAAGPLPRGTETLLVVEDEPSLRSLASSVLETQGYTVLRAASGQDGLRVASEHKGQPIRLAMTDVIMPQMGGKVMADWLKTTYPDLKILFTSGYTDDAIAHHGVLEPGVAFLPKPYTPGILARKVRAMLDNETDTAHISKLGVTINPIGSV